MSIYHINHISSTGFYASELKIWNFKNSRWWWMQSWTSSSAITEWPRDARGTSIRKIAKWNFWAWGA